MEILTPLLIEILIFILGVLMLFGFYPLPVALICAALVRLGLGWTATKRLTA